MPARVARTANSESHKSPGLSPRAVITHMTGVKIPAAALERFLKKGWGAVLVGSVVRHSAHYVHERTTVATVEWLEALDAPQHEIAWAEMVTEYIEQDMQDRVVAWNKQIYRDLEQEYEYRTSQSAVEESIQVRKSQ